MSTILNAVTSLVTNVTDWVENYLGLFFTYAEGQTGPSAINGLSFIGIVCIAVPLVGLGIGIIRRLVQIRA